MPLVATASLPKIIVYRCRVVVRRGWIRCASTSQYRPHATMSPPNVQDKDGSGSSSAHLRMAAAAGSMMYAFSSASTFSLLPDGPIGDTPPVLLFRVAIKFNNGLKFPRRDRIAVFEPPDFAVGFVCAQDARKSRTISLSAAREGSGEACRTLSHGEVHRRADELIVVEAMLVSGLETGKTSVGPVPEEARNKTSV